ncbi:phosphopyruvate hydratase [bacterium]|nr:MAG: phosphopyruvate hydratase [bacterium]
MGKIKQISASPVLNSRGDWTVQVDLILSDGSRVSASAPQGKSSGSAEAHEVDWKSAIKNINEIIAKEFKGAPLGSQNFVDKRLLALDGTVNKNRLGGNTTLAFSTAYAKASASAKKLPVWKYLRKIFGPKVADSKRPLLFCNLINGGAHADNGLDFQEYLVIPQAASIRESTDIAAKIYLALKKYLSKKYGAGATGVGDEGGFAPVFEGNTKPFEILEKVAKEEKLSKKVCFGMDAAATGIKLSKQELTNFYANIIKRYDLQYLEDPFSENDFQSFAKLSGKFGGKVWIAGDDLTTTNLARMQEAYESKSINSMIIKPNQIGTVSEALAAVRQARKWGWKVVVSHRSGETNDDFIADFAYGVGADGVKLGAPARGERVAKYNRLLEIEREI